MTAFFQALQFPFMYRALIVGVLVSLCAALLGVVLVLKHYSLIGQRGVSEGSLPSSGHQRVVFSVFDDFLLWFSWLSADLLSPHMHLVYQFFKSTLGSWRK